MTVRDKKSEIFGTGPVLPVHDIRAAVDYYCDTLGFSLDFVMGDPPSHGSVARDCVGIQFTNAPASFEPRSYPGYNYFFVDNIDDLHSEFIAKSVPITRAIMTHDHGMREFEILDCNGFRLRFGQYI
jgi:catechol 2,3-dioxygenase-like lactoylglutathione lyase family enzyme